MIRNIDAMQFKSSSKGNGNDTHIPHRKTIINGQKTQAQLDGCYKFSTCEICELPVEQCNGSFRKPLGGRNHKG